MMRGGKVRRGFALVLAIALILAMMPAVALAETSQDTLPWPEAVGGVITLDGEGTYGTYPGTIVISEGVTIDGNGATVLSNISIQTDQPVTIRNIKSQPNLIDSDDNGTVRYSKKRGIIVTGVGNSSDGYYFDVTIEGCTFGNPADPKPPYRSIYMPENTASQRGSLIVRNCTFNEAIYNINLLRVENITIENNIFNIGGQSAVQYTVDASNKNNIKIRNNTFNGTGIALLATIAGGTFDGPDGHIGNVESNTFNGTRAVISVSDQNIETLTIPSSSGLSVSKVYFSAYSHNLRFKPAATGPWSPALEGRLVISGETGVTDAAELANAIVNAEDGDTIQLTGDIADIQEMQINKAITIDMNGFDISGNPSSYTAFKVVDGGNLALNNTSATQSQLLVGEGNEYEAYFEGIRMTAGGKATVGANVSIETGCPVFIVGDGTAGSAQLDVYGRLKVSDDLSDGDAYAAIQGNGTAGNGGTLINIYDGAEVVNEFTAPLYIPQDGVVNVSGGLITGKSSGIALKSGTLNITGGTISATGVAQVPEGWSNGINASGAAIQMESNSGYIGNMVINITGGTIISENGYALYEYIGGGTKTAVSGISLSGGYFSGAMGLSHDLGETQSEKISITGGYFSSDPSEYVPEESHVVTTGNWGGGKYGYMVVNADEVPLNEIVSASAKAYIGGDVDNNSELTVSVSGESIAVAGKVSAAVSKIIITYTRTDGATETVTISKVEGAFVQPDDITVADTTYSINISGLSIMPAGVAVISAPPIVAVGDDIAEEDQAVAQAAADAIKDEGVTAAGLAGAAAGQLVTDDGGVKAGNTVITADSQAVADALSESGLIVGEEQEVIIVAQTYMEIAVIGITTDESGVTTLRLDIEPMYNVVAVVVDQGAPVTSVETGGGGNAAVVSGGQSMRVTTPIVVSVPLPNNMEIDADNFFVEHISGSGTYYYKAEVKGSNPRIATFTVPNGFSVFTFMTDTRSATIDFGDGGVEYNLSNVGDAFPEPTRGGYAFTGWIFDGITGSYTSMTDELLTLLDGQTVTATAGWTAVIGRGTVTDTATEFDMIDTAPPIITSVKATPYGANGAILEVTAVDASEPLFYQWQVAGSWIDIPGATTARYDYTNLLANASYTVRVKVTDAFGNSAISQEVTFRTGAQAISGLPDSYSLHKGQSVSWPSAAGATWNYDEEYLSMKLEGDRVTFTAKKTGETAVVCTVGGTQHVIFITIYRTATIPQTGYSVNSLSYLLMGLSALSGMSALIGRKKRSR
jgi:LPXTG-motif cell wall-anchored protein/uncharacterized repeat protein (TIGR02543 family)